MDGSDSALRRSTLTRRHFMTAALALGLTPHTAHAQTYPSHLTRVLVGFSAGSISDLLARALAANLEKEFGQPVIVENRPGAGGLLAARALMQSPADGYTLLVVSASYAAAPAITRDLGFDPVQDLSGVTRIANVPSILVANPKLGTKTLAHLLQLLRQSPGTLNYSSPGRGSANHFAGEYFLSKAKVKATHVPYRGVPEAVMAVVAGDCQFSCVPAPNSLSLIQDGKLVALAATTSERSRLLPGMPTIAEAGVPGYEFDPWFGVLTRAGVPPEVHKKLVDTSVRVLSAPDMQARFAPLGADISTMPGASFDTYIKQEIAKFRDIAKLANIEPT